MDLPSAVGISSKRPSQLEDGALRPISRTPTRPQQFGEVRSATVAARTGGSRRSSRATSPTCNRRLPCGSPTQSRLPSYGMSRKLSLPCDRDTYRNEYVTSYRVRNGALHNPKSDRRTTKGTFHVCEGGLPIPGDKKSVPRPVFAALFRHALHAAGGRCSVVPWRVHAAEASRNKGVLFPPQAPDRLPRGARRRSRENDGSPFLRPGRAR